MIDVNKIAKLARIKVNAEEEQKYHEQLNAICKYFEEIESVDTTNVEPLVTPSEIELVFREDNAEKGLSTEEAMMNAPERMGQLYKVPPVV